MNFYKSFTSFQKVFFLFFTMASIIVFLLPLSIEKGSLSSVFSFLGIIGIICTISGILVSIYTAKANISGYFFWTINTVTLAIIAMMNSLYGQFIENLFIVLPLVIYGFIAWRRHLSRGISKEITVNKFTKKQGMLALLLFLGCFILYALFLKTLPSLLYNCFHIKIAADPQIILDAITATLTIMAVLLTAKRYIEQWTFWIISNILGLIMFVMQTIHTGISNPSMFIGDLSNTLSILQYTVGSIYGYLLWRKMYNQPKVEMTVQSFSQLES